MKLHKLFVCAVVCLLALPAAAGVVNPGKWQVVVETEMVGMPHKVPTQTVSHCVTKEDAEKAESMIKSGGMGKDCKLTDVTTTGSTASWKIECPSQGVKGEGKMTFSADTYSGTSKMKMGEIEVIQKMDGKRVGECEK